ncbi:MAG: site-specific integrase [Actinomycetota bacterium]|nr:site-specific integrase [Actinomycetota bacterium]
MTALAPLLQGFFAERLARQRNASPHTIAAYRDGFRLLLSFMHERTGTQPSKLRLEDLDAATISAFLDHLETSRGNSIRTRNARLTAIHSFYRYSALKAPEQAELIARVLAIPDKRFETTLISYLDPPEIDALLTAPDRSTPTGRRDHALLLLAVQTGLRASELASLRRQDLQLDTSPWVRCEGKGRKERCTPLTRTTVRVLRVWLRENDDTPTSPLFPGPRGQHLTRGAIWRLVIKHAATASERCPSLQSKHITPHTLRHTAAMQLLRTPDPVDTATIALWLGHESLDSTNKYIHADLELKRRALDRTTPPNAKPGHYKPSDPLLAFLENL